LSRLHARHRAAGDRPHHELIPHSAASQRAAWAQATTLSRCSRPAGAYGLSYLFAPQRRDYTRLFVIGAAQCCPRWRSN